MKYHFRLAVFISVFSLFLLAPGLNAEEQPASDTSQATISMDFQDANLNDVLKVFSIQSGFNFIASDTVVNRKITIYLDNVPIQEAMNKLFQANNLSYELDKTSNILVVKDWGKPKAETITQVFFLKYATVSTASLIEEMSNNIAGGIAGVSISPTSSSTTTSEGRWKTEEESGITQAIKKLLSENGSIIEDFRTNSLIITDMPSRMPVIAQTIAALDISVPQVLIEVEMLDVSKNSVDKIGFKFGQSPFTFVLTGATSPTGFPFNYSSFNFTKTFVPGTIAANSGANTYSVVLDFLKTQTDTKYLARPKLLTLSNETAEIKITTQETVGLTVSTTGGGASTTQITGVPERTETGVSLRVTPQVNLETGEITMFIVPTVKDTSTSTFLVQGSTTQYFKDPEERSTKSTVRIKDGDTVIIGGLLRRDSNQIVTKLPILGDIPILGRLFFTNKNKEKDRERELLVFITPHIVKDTNIELAQAKKIVIPEREQGTASAAIKRETAINTNLNRLDKKKK